MQTHCDVDTKFVVATLFHLHRRRRIHLHRRRRIRWCNFGATKIVLLAFSAAVLFVCLKMLRGQNAKLFVATLFHLVVVMDCATQLNGEKTTMTCSKEKKTIAGSGEDTNNGLDKCFFPSKDLWFLKKLDKHTTFAQCWKCRSLW